MKIINLSTFCANVMSRKQVAFDNGRTDVQDEQRSGRPITSTTDDNLCRIEGLIQEDRRIRVSEHRTPRQIGDEFQLVMCRFDAEI
jgi:hypothetical protein